MEEVLQKLYSMEFNVCISAFWDCGWDVKIGDDANGYLAEGNFEKLSEVVEWLKEFIQSNK